ncbi:MAG: phosphotransferase family protein [Frankiales bacterium]|nr:phosphotransferase family protein [Frankiales bacterium]
MTTDAPLDQRLADLLREVLADPAAQVRGVRQLSGGASRETWAFELVPGSGAARTLVLRRDPPLAPRPELMALEARATEAAAAAGVPEPAIVASGSDPDVLGAPFIISKFVPGETLARRILRDDAYAQIRPHLAAQCGDLLARIHSVPLDSVPGLASADPLQRSREGLDTLGWSSPTLELALRWLERTRPPASGHAMVHGDFRNGNLIVGPEGVRAVLDWEVVHAGDPMEDLGWLCVRAWRFGSDLPVGGFGTREQLFEAYAQTSGTKVDPEVVRWWEVLGTMRWGIGCMVQAERHLRGTTRSVELAAIGRRVCEQEYDVLLVLDELLGEAT